MNVPERWWPILLVLAFLLTYIALLGVRPMVLPDEYRYAQVPLEMIRSGDWIVPHLNGLPYFEKPILGYWLHAVCMLLFGAGAFAIRLPSALAVGGTAWIIYGLLRKEDAPQPEALLGAGAYLTCVGVFAVGVFAILDSVFSGLICLALVLLFRALTNEGGQGFRWRAALAGAVIGLAVLQKGLAGAVLPAVVLGPFILWERRWRQIPGLVLLTASTGLAVVLPWALLIHQQAPGFWGHFLGSAHFNRFLSADEFHHPEPIWYYLVALPLMALPWSVVAPAALPGLRRLIRCSVLVRFCLCWLFGFLVFFSLARGKLATYLLPAVPALILLLILGLQRSPEEVRDRRLRRGMIGFAGLLGLVALGVPLIHCLGPESTRIYQSGWKVALLTISVAGWALLSLQAARRDRADRLVIYAAGPLLFMVAAHLVLPAGVEDGKAPGRWLEPLARTIPRETVVVTDSRLLYPACFHLGRSDLMMLGAPDELKHAVSLDGSRYVTRERLLRLARGEEAGDQDLVLLLDRTRHERFRVPELRPTEIRQLGERIFCSRFRRSPITDSHRPLAP